MTRLFQEFSCGGYYEDPLTRFFRALGIAMILFGIFAPGRFTFFWIGVILVAVCGIIG